MSTFTVEIKEASRELSKRDRVKLKDTGNSIKLDECVDIDSSFVLAPTGYAILAIHNEKAEDKDYEQYLIEAKDGHKYVTGSSSFWETFKSIWDEMEGEEYEVEVYKVESKNYKGKHFLSCSLV